METKLVEGSAAIAKLQKSFGQFEVSQSSVSVITLSTSAAMLSSTVVDHRQKQTAKQINF